MHELLTPLQMALADRLTIESGRPGLDLMEAAGAFLHAVLNRHFPDCSSIAVVCGPGNNGGDGFVLARLLAKDGKQVDVQIAADHSSIKGEAGIALDRLPVEVNRPAEFQPESYDLIVDALFGAGLSRAIEGKLAALIDEINKANAAILSVDLPSGISGLTGQRLGTAVKADVTATFFRMKPGHLLFPGRAHCGTTELGQIGISDAVFNNIPVDHYRNQPPLWINQFPRLAVEGHKYHRGHTLVVSGSLEKSGAARLMAKSALRVGSGLVTIGADKATLPVHAARLDTIMLATLNAPADLSTILEDHRINVLGLGPGLTPDETTQDLVLAAAESGRALVLDAGGLSAFRGQSDLLFDAVKASQIPVVFTPHDGEFKALFSDLSEIASKPERARKAATRSGAVVILKGADTVVASPEGMIAISDNAPPWLATAGSGDVLGGLVAGLFAQGMPGFEAACAAVWIHGEAANRVGPGLIASDLDGGVKLVLEELNQPVG
ncbi:MAG: NAD(P)H-hydrate dehydratase [Pseudomonadota bacterium]